MNTTKALNELELLEKCNDLDCICHDFGCAMTRPLVVSGIYRINIWEDPTVWTEVKGVTIQVQSIAALANMVSNFAENHEEFLWGTSHFEVELKNGHAIKKPFNIFDVVPAYGTDYP